MAMCNMDEPCVAKTNWGYCRLKGTRIERNTKEIVMAKEKRKIKCVWKRFKNQFLIVPTFGILTYDPSEWDWYEYIPQFAVSFAWLCFGFKIEFDKLSAFADALPCHRREIIINMEIKN